MSKKKLTEGLIQRESGQWVRAEKIDGKRRFFTSRDPAEVWKKRDAAVAKAANESIEKDEGPLFSEVAESYEAKVLEMKFGTQKAYIPAIRRAVKCFGNMRIKKIEPYMIAEFLDSMKSSAHTTVSNQKTVINAIFRTWISSPKWHGDKNPAELVKMPHGLNRGKRQPPTDAQVQIVKTHYMDPDALPAVVFLCTGERRAEACGIQMRDVDFSAGTISITKQAEYRGNAATIVSYAKTPASIRTVPLLDMLRKALEPLRFRSDDTYILSGTDKPLTAAQYKRRWSTFWEKYGCTHSTDHNYSYTNRHGTKSTYKHTEITADVCAHQFRHEYVCMLCEADVPEAIAIQIIGHANAKMIHEVYLALKPKMLNDTREKLDKLLV